MLFSRQPPSTNFSIDIEVKSPSKLLHILCLSRLPNGRDLMNFERDNLGTRGFPYGHMAQSMRQYLRVIARALPVRDFLWILLDSRLVSVENK